MLARLSSLVMGLVAAGCSVVGVRSGYEAPPYQVAERLGEAIEIRDYGPRLVAEVTVEHPPGDAEAGRSAAFRLLAGYIFGGNTARPEAAGAKPGSAQDIAMTVPVEVRPVEVAPFQPAVSASAAEARVTMRFFLPASLTLATAPIPQDARVVVREVPGARVAALRFSGLSDENDLKARAAELRQALAARGLAATGGAASTLYYDPPWTLPPFRRTEVALQLAGR